MSNDNRRRKWVRWLSWFVTTAAVAFAAKHGIVLNGNPPSF